MNLNASEKQHYGVLQAILKNKMAKAESAKALFYA